MNNELAATILRHPWLADREGLYAGVCPSCPDLKINGGHNSPSHAYHLADAIHSAGYRKPRTITTAEELDALPFESVVTDDYDTPYVCERHATDGTRNEWRMSGQRDYLHESYEVLLSGPITVRWEPQP